MRRAAPAPEPRAGMLVCVCDPQLDAPANDNGPRAVSTFGLALGFAFAVLAQTVASAALPLAGAQLAPRPELVTWPFAALLLGAALANLGREVFQIVVTETVRRRLCRDEIPLNVPRIGWILAPAAVAYAAGWYLFGTEVDPRMTAEKVLLTFAFLAAAIFGPGIGPAGRAMLVKLLPGTLRRAPSSAS